ncbi:hypothetical protein [Paenibacillus eucommiae]|uniref:Uncharacterized protein n=1 Tax=Paenibacillus eucommiae TaxID=1355755 RepID=A0ABS4IV65_9BACL|nr:hypothetical protein [Paenibacillus eucommiae]MBP1991393.1 hypothetical protein [Paenibacillus eucommiae]
MFLTLLVKLIASFIFVTALVIINFVIFKIPIKGNDKQIVLLALIVGTTNFYFKFILDSSYFMLIQTLVYIIALTALRGYPILYAFLVCTIGSLVVSFIDVIVTIGAIRLNLSTLEAMQQNLGHFFFFHMLTSVVYVVLAFILYRRKIGFSFLVRKFYVMEKYNFLWIILLLVTTLILIVGTQGLKIFSLQGYILLFVLFGLVGSLIYGYSQNKKALRERYDIFKEE